MKIIHFFGDGEHVFDLTPAMITELERKTGVGIGSLIRRVDGYDFHLGDLIETIRLALIGGGMAPAEAHTLTTTYTTGRPIGEFLPVAIQILNATWFGGMLIPADDADQPDEEAPE